MFFKTVLTLENTFMQQKQMFGGDVTNPECIEKTFKNLTEWIEKSSGTSECSTNAHNPNIGLQLVSCAACSVKLVLKKQILT